MNLSRRISQAYLFKMMVGEGWYRLGIGRRCVMLSRLSRHYFPATAGENGVFVSTRCVRGDPSGLSTEEPTVHVSLHSLILNDCYSLINNLSLITLEYYRFFTILEALLFHVKYNKNTHNLGICTV